MKDRCVKCRKFLPPLVNSSINIPETDIIITDLHKHCAADIMYRFGFTLKGESLKPRPAEKRPTSRAEWIDYIRDELSICVSIQELDIPGTIVIEYPPGIDLDRLQALVEEIRPVYLHVVYEPKPTWQSVTSYEAGDRVWVQGREWVCTQSGITGESWIDHDSNSPFPITRKINGSTVWVLEPKALGVEPSNDTTLIRAMGEAIDRYQENIMRSLMLPEKFVNPGKTANPSPQLLDTQACTKCGLQYERISLTEESRCMDCLTKFCRHCDRPVSGEDNRYIVYIEGEPHSPLHDECCEPYRAAQARLVTSGIQCIPTLQCECGTDAAGGGLHSDWCPKSKKAE